MNNKNEFPFLGYGVGLRPPHYSYILENRPDVGWLEIISENYMDSEGSPRRILEQVREHYPVAMHGVSLSIGTTDPLNSEYLKNLKNLAAWLRPAWISDHLCWTGVAHKNTHDLLPVPYTEQALKHITGRIQDVQDFLERPIVLENPSTYLEFTSSSMSEWEFITRMSEDSDCGLLLDANNIYVSCYNHRWDPQTYIDSLPLDRVVQIHLAGHTNNGTHIIDTHNDHVVDEVWALYHYIIQKAGHEITTMVEWDADIPDFPVVQAEVNKARKWARSAHAPVAMPVFPGNRDNFRPSEKSPAFAEQLQDMQNAIVSGEPQHMSPDETIIPKPDFSPEEQIDVYIRGYRCTLFDAIAEDCTALKTYLGEEEFSKQVRAYIKATPSVYYDLSRYIEPFPEFVKNTAGDEFAGELALLEKTISRLHDAPDSPVLSVSDLASLTPEDLMQSHLELRDALVLFAFAGPVNDYYSAVMEDQTPDAPAKQASYLAVYRHNDTVWRLPLDETEHLLLSSLKAGMSVEEALQAALPQNDEEAALAEKLSGWFSRWVSNNLIKSLRPAVRQEKRRV